MHTLVYRKKIKNKKARIDRALEPPSAHLLSILSLINANFQRILFTQFHSFAVCKTNDVHHLWMGTIPG